MHTYIYFIQMPIDALSTIPRARHLEQQPWIHNSIACRITNDTLVQTHPTIVPVPLSEFMSHYTISGHAQWSKGSPPILTGL